MLETAFNELQKGTPKGDAEALDLSNLLIERDPSNAEALYIAGMALQRMQQNGLSAILLNAAAQGRPDQPAIWNNLGCALQEWRPKDAIAVFGQALDLKPDFLEARKNVAACLNRVGRRSEAIELARALRDENPDDPDIPYNLALDLFHTPDWAEAWSAYRYSEGNAQRTVRNYQESGTTPRWEPGTSLTTENGEPARVVIYGEQGVGDEILAASMYGQLEAEAARLGIDFVFECDERLTGIYKRSFPWAEVHGTRKQKVLDWPKEGPVDAALIAFGLGSYYMPKPVTVQPWLTPDPDLVAFFKAYLATLGDGPKIGLSWTGGAVSWDIAERSIDPELLGPFITTPAAVVVSLEYKEGETPDGVHVMPWATHKGVDLDITAALIAALDVVVSVPQTACDIAGAVGTPLIALVSENPPWRFAEAAGDAWIWRDCKTYRKKPGATWLPTIANAARDFRGL